jgi:hypothetical protein
LHTSSSIDTVSIDYPHVSIGHAPTKELQVR